MLSLGIAHKWPLLSLTRICENGKLCRGGGLVVGNNAWWSVDLGEKSVENVIYFFGSR